MSRAVERPQSFPLILFFCWLSCRRGKWLSVRSVTSPCASLSVPAEESKGWSATIFWNEDEQWEARKTMARLEQIAAQEYGFAYADELHEKEIGRKGL